jgi:Tfp pilus assembly protein FimT
MAEMLAVIVIIGILAVAASPFFVSAMRDRRVNRAAMQYVDFFRTARMRALGRGVPVLVSWNKNGGGQNGASGLLTMQEPVVTTLALSTTCSTTPWAAQTPQPLQPGVTQEVARFDVGNGLYAKTDVAFSYNAAPVGSNDPADPNNPNVQAIAEVCFSPRGRTFIRFAPGAPFIAVAGVMGFRVTNTATTLIRSVIIPPNGAARMGL